LVKKSSSAFNQELYLEETRELLHSFSEITRQKNQLPLREAPIRSHASRGLVKLVKACATTATPTSLPRKENRLHKVPAAALEAAFAD
jgi:hypothetical protein